MLKALPLGEKTHGWQTNESSVRLAEFSASILSISPKAYYHILYYSGLGAEDWGDKRSKEGIQGFLDVGRNRTAV